MTVLDIKIIKEKRETRKTTRNNKKAQKSCAQVWKRNVYVVFVWKREIVVLRQEKKKRSNTKQNKTIKM